MSNQSAQVCRTWRERAQKFVHYPSTIREIGGQALGIQADISDTVAVDDMVRQTVDAFGNIDILINNAATAS